MRVLKLGLVFPRVVCAAMLALALVAVSGMGSLPASAQQEVTVDMPSFSFAPATITVPVGTRVTWTHSHMNIPHDVTSDTGVFSSPRRMMMGQTFSYTFTQPGMYPYTCTIHAERMKGMVIVTEQAAGTARPAATGTGGGMVAAATARPATVPAAMPRSGAGGTATRFVDEAPATRVSWMLLAGGVLVAGAAGASAFRRRVR